MNFSIKIKKFCDGMIVYDHLLEDEGAIHIPFALSFYVTITTIVGQLKQFLIDLKNHVCHEIPDINIEQMDVDKIMSPKFKWDMKSFGNITMRELLEKLFGPLLDKTPLEFFYAIRDNVAQMVQHVVEIRKVLDNSKPELFGKYICRRMEEGNYDDVKENYAKWKKKHAEVTMDMLLAKQEQMLRTYLDKGIMRFEESPTNMMMKMVDYDYHTAHLDCEFQDTEEYKKAYAKLMGYAIRNEGMLCINYNKYGKYVFDNYDRFTEGQKPALLELCVVLDLIHKDMVELKPELAKYLGNDKVNLESLENTKYFAPYFHIKEMLRSVWFKKLRAEAKYNEKWADAFAEALIRSEYALQIVNDWSEKNNQIKGYVIGCLKEAGVFRKDVSNDCIARDAGIMSNTRTFGKYIGKESQEQPYSEWIINHVNDYC